MHSPSLLSASSPLLSSSSLSSSPHTHTHTHSPSPSPSNSTTSSSGEAGLGLDWKDERDVPIAEMMGCVGGDGWGAQRSMGYRVSKTDKKGGYLTYIVDESCLARARRDGVACVAELTLIFPHAPLYAAARKRLPAVLTSLRPSTFFRDVLDPVKPSSIPTTTSSSSSSSSSSTTTPSQPDEIYLQTASLLIPPPPVSTLEKSLKSRLDPPIARIALIVRPAGFALGDAGVKCVRAWVSRAEASARVEEVRRVEQAKRLTEVQKGGLLGIGVYGGTWVGV
ncbi:hypothetical protein M427DRAFT_135500 [Gonapodya prolifera JEL478]|uniref:Uncharacterized protein n=1 Tax=Gonapodya prolifera (strain JEL478) TaxID=1344416 RepID=A0A139ADY8_GONPJ|nr:hypothetical protein M427DRAFT_135500 [Gonapodya prolifera JEL478]|eukprot:KXS14804.1 hypothetical protein M427DRAFT_135500 [Gonapodya prolifera JEL478]